MIFVTVGSFRLPFDRLIEVADTLAGDEPVVVQHGVSRVGAPGCITFDYLTADAFEEHVREARVVIAHAGVGSAASCLRHGKRPILVPRLRRLGENVDDHQTEFARRLERLGLAVVVARIDELAARVRTHRSELSGPLGLSPVLSRELTSFVAGDDRRRLRRVLRLA